MNVSPGDYCPDVFRGVWWMKVKDVLSGIS